MLRNLMSRLYEENLFYAHIVWIDVLRIRSFQIIVKIDHMLDGCIKLSFISTVEISSSVLKLTNLCFNLVKILSHLLLVLVMGLCNGLQTPLEFLLISDVKHTLVLILVLQTFKLFLNLSMLASLSLTTELLFTIIIAPLVLNWAEIFSYFLSEGCHLLNEGDRYFNRLVLHI